MSISKFRPTVRMRRFLRAILLSDGPRKMKKLCSEARITEMTYIRWLEDRNGFCRWLNQKIQQHVAARAWEVLLRHLEIALAEKENIQAIKLLYERLAQTNGETTQEWRRSLTELLAMIERTPSAREDENDGGKAAALSQARVAS